jgi:LPS O-antigen subunit length determinant protein (WzzB/FepE family)
MTSSSSRITSKNIPEPENSLQPIIYGVLPEQAGDEIDLGELLSKLASQWKTILLITLGGTVLAILIALMLPRVYQPSVTVSLPLAGHVASVEAINTFLDGTEKNVENNLTPTSQIVFNNYYNLLRSKKVFDEYVHEKKYIQKLYPGAKETESLLLAAGLISTLNINIEEPSPEKRGGYIANPERVKISLNINNEAIGVDLLNGFSNYVNQRLITSFQNDTNEIIKKKIETRTLQVASLRDQYRQQRLLTIKRIQQENAEKVAQLKEQISATLRKAKANRKTKIASAKEAQEMAKSLSITYPTTLEALAQRDKKGGGANTAITVVDKQSSSLYLQGTKFLSTLIETLEKRKSDEKYLVKVNDLREKIQLIENDPVLAALKTRESDDPWVEDLPEKLAEINALKQLNPDFMNLVAFSLDESALVSGSAVKPKKTMIVIIGFVLSMILAIFVAMIIASIKKK